MTKQANAFHDVPSGSTIATICYAGTPNCKVSVTGDSYGVLSGYSTGPGYDLATGLGSVDVNNLVSNWTKATFTATTTALQLNSGNAVNVKHGTAVPVSIGVTSASATGQASLLVSTGIGTSTGQAIDTFTLSSGSTPGATTSMLPGGTYSVIAHYAGDGNYGGSYSSPVSVTVSKENSQPQTFLVTFDSGGNVVNADTMTAPYGSPYILRINMENSAGQLCKPVGSGATACPSGTVALTNNGTPLDAGTYTLNSYGYTEDVAVQLPGGTNSVQATYAGDNSFNASTATSAITITPASTSVTQPSVLGAVVGQAALITVYVDTTGTGVVPTGTITFYANGAAIGGTVTYTQSPGLSATILTSTSAFTIVGSYAITATYSGDTNYATSTSSADNIAVQLPQPAVSASPYSSTIQAGTTLTETVLVDTTNKTAYPSGTVTLFSNSVNGPLAGPIACTNTTDSSGFYACQATFTLTPGASMNFWAQYSGDANYPQGISGAYYITVSDFALAPGAQQVTVPQGQSLTVGINTTAISGFTGNVTSFTCSGLPAETSCTFSPTTVAVGSSTTLTISTTPLGQLRRRAVRERGGAWWIADAFFPLLGICLIGVSAFGRRRQTLWAMMLVVSMITLLSCGGSGGGGGSTPNPVPAITSLSPTQQAAGSASQSLTISGSGFISGSAVTYNGVAHAATLLSGSQLSISLAATDLSATGSYPVVVTNPSPGGGASSAVNFSVVTGTPTGTFNVTVTAASGSLTHTGSFSLIVQ